MLNRTFIFFESKLRSFTGGIQLSTLASIQDIYVSFTYCFKLKIEDHDMLAQRTQMKIHKHLHMWLKLTINRKEKNNLVLNYRWILFFTRWDLFVLILPREHILRTLIAKWSIWTVPEDTVPTNFYTSSYLGHRTVQYSSHLRDHSLSDSCRE